MRKKITDFIVFWIPTLFWMGVIFYFSSRPRVSVSEKYLINFLFFKTLHIIEYAVLYFLLFRSFKKRFFYAFLFSLLYAATDEIHQMFVPTREGKIRDVLIDAIGIGVMYIYIKNNLSMLKRFL